jgi:hypothetical protein
LEAFFLDTAAAAVAGGLQPHKEQAAAAAGQGLPARLEPCQHPAGNLRALLLAAEQPSKQTISAVAAAAHKVLYLTAPATLNMGALAAGLLDTALLAPTAAFR